MPAASELVAAGRTEDEVRQLIGADWLIYQDLEDLVQACQHDDARTDHDRRNTHRAAFAHHWISAASRRLWIIDVLSKNARESSGSLQARMNSA